MQELNAKINAEKLLEEEGLSFDSPADLISYAQSLADYLATHNKNYTRAQYHRIESLRAILDALEA